MGAPSAALGLWCGHTLVQVTAGGQAIANEDAAHDRSASGRRCPRQASRLVGLAGPGRFFFRKDAASLRAAS